MMINGQLSVISVIWHTNALLQIIRRHVLEVDLLGAVDVCSICEDADGHARAGDVGESVQYFK